MSIYVSEACRGKGAGGILLEKAFEACPRLGLKRLVGRVRPQRSELEAS
ncbi:GNAT family N-acetyltransferase [Paenibacillus sp. JTLBN-2024]